MRKSKVLLFQVLVTIILLTTCVYAALDVTLELNVSSSTVKPGDDVIVTLSLKDVNSKITSVSGYINYNKDILETLTVNSIVKDSDNTVTIGNEKLAVEDLTNKGVNDMPSTSEYVGFNGAPTSGNDTRIVIDFKNGISENTDLLKIKFKVKSTATIGEIKDVIKYQMFVITAGTEKTEEISQNIDLTVVKANSPEEDKDNTSNGNEKGNNTASSSEKGNNTASGSEKGNNTASGSEKGNNTASGSEKGNNIVSGSEKGNNTASGSIKGNNVVNNAVRNNTVNNTNKTNKVNNTFSNTDNTTASRVLPATGAKILVIPAITLITLAYVCYNKYMKYKNL